MSTLDQTPLFTYHTTFANKKKLQNENGELARQSERDRKEKKTYYFAGTECEACSCLFRTTFQLILIYLAQTLANFPAPMTLEVILVREMMLY